MREGLQSVHHSIVSSENHDGPPKAVIEPQTMTVQTQTNDQALYIYGSDCSYCLSSVWLWPLTSELSPVCCFRGEGEGLQVLPEDVGQRERTQVRDHQRPAQDEPGEDETWSSSGPG